MANNIMNMDGSFKPFRAWCQLVLPQVYDDSLSYMELLNKVIAYINSFGEYLEEFTAINKVKYGGPWDVTKQYTPNTVVSVGDTGYMSIKPVPAGIDIHNTDYWLQVADFAGQIVDLGIRVIALENAMETANTNISNLQTAMTNANENISGLTTRMTNAETAISNTNENISDLTTRMTNAETTISTIEGNITTINNAINRVNNITENRTFTGRRIICIGDSYGHTPSEENGWINKLKIYSQLTSDDFASDYHDGSGFIGLGDERPTFLEMLQGITISNPATITDIIVAGGYNDAAILKIGNSSDTDMRAAIANFNTYANTIYPNAKIHIIPCCWCNHDNSMHKYIRQMVNNYNQCPTFAHNAIFTDCALYCLHDTELLDNTGFHPTDPGSSLIAESIASHLLGGSGYISTPVGEIVPTWTPISANGVNSVSISDAKMFIDKNIVNFNCSLIIIQGSNMNCISGRLLQVAEFTKTVMLGAYPSTEFYSAFTLGVVGNTYFNCFVYISDGKLAIMPLNYNISNASSIAIYGVQLSGSAML